MPVADSTGQRLGELKWAIDSEKLYIDNSSENVLINPITEEQFTSLSGSVTGKQDTLVSGTNIKTINNQTILGSGNLDIESNNGVLTMSVAGQETATTSFSANQNTNSTFDVPLYKPDNLTKVDGFVYQDGSAFKFDDLNLNIGDILYVEQQSTPNPTRKNFVATKTINVIEDDCCSVPTSGFETTQVQYILTKSIPANTWIYCLTGLDRPVVTIIKLNSVYLTSGGVCVPGVVNDDIVGTFGKVQDVTVNGESVLNQATKVADVPLYQPGTITEVSFATQEAGIFTTILELKQNDTIKLVLENPLMVGLQYRLTYFPEYETDITNIIIYTAETNTFELNVITDVPVGSQLVICSSMAEDPSGGKMPIPTTTVSNTLLSKSQGIAGVVNDQILDGYGKVEDIRIGGASVLNEITKIADIPIATTTINGIMSTQDKAKLDRLNYSVYRHKVTLKTTTGTSSSYYSYFDVVKSDNIPFVFDTLYTYIDNMGDTLLAGGYVNNGTTSYYPILYLWSYAESGMRKIAVRYSTNGSGGTDDIVINNTASITDNVFET
jgi:hypothetical protein